MLSEQERINFVANGFIAKRRALDSRACQRCVEVAWKELRAKSIGTDSSTWASHPYLRPRRGVVKLREEIAPYPLLSELVADNHTINQVARELIGDRTQNMGVRGLYPTFPVSRLRARPYEPHIEVHPVQVFVMVYLDDVTEDNGAMCAWPGSHTAVYPHFDSKYEDRIRPAFHIHFSRFNMKEPVQLTGRAGDAYFCHHRLLHSGSNNFQSRVRLGCLTDFIRQDYEELSKLPPNDNMWEDWSEELQASAVAASDATPMGLKFSLSRALSLTAIHASRRLRGRSATEYSQ